jgi:hypothetical protein
LATLKEGVDVLLENHSRSISGRILFGRDRKKIQKRESIEKKQKKKQTIIK